MRGRSRIVPPSIVLIILGDQMRVSVGDLFLGALIPGIMLSGLFVLWIGYVALRHPERAPALPVNAINRHGVSLPWSGTRIAVATISRSSSGVGPGVCNCAAGTERRARRNPRACSSRIGPV